jgi:hypothetical protein
MDGRNDIETADVTENVRDENMIISDQDQTESGDPGLHDDNLGQDEQFANSLEDEPGDFVRGEVDVVEQMKRATRAMDDVIQGHGEGGTRT